MSQLHFLNSVFCGRFGASRAPFCTVCLPAVQQSVREVGIAAGTRGSSSLCLHELPEASAASCPVRLCSVRQVGNKGSGFCSDLSSLPFLSFSSKPRLLLLPVVCQRNLFSLLLAVQAVVPGSCLARLLRAVERDSHGDPWVRALGNLLRRGPQGEPCSPPHLPLSAACQQQLWCLCRRIARNKPEGQRKLNWCFSKQPGATGDVADSVLQGGKRKKVLEGSLEMDEGRVGKRPLLEEAAFDLPGTQESGDVPGAEEEVPGETLGDRSARSPSAAAQGSSQQDAAGGPGKVSQAELAAELQSFLQVLCRDCFPLPAREPLQSDFCSFTSFSPGAWTEAENAAAEGIQRKWFLLSLFWS